MSVSRPERSDCARLAAALAVALSWAGLAGAQPAASAPSAASARIAELNARFVAHLRTLSQTNPGADKVLAGEGAAERDSGAAFVPDALAALYPEFGQALAAFDDDRYADVLKLTAPLLKESDPFLAANAGYLYARTLVQRGMFEEGEEYLAQAVQECPAEHTPYAPHLELMLGLCQAADLKFAAAVRGLQAARQAYPDAPEAVRAATYQLLLELQRRSGSKLDQVGELMNYAADRLGAADATTRVQERQQQAVALLDELIEDAKQREQQQQQNSSAKRGQSPGKPSPGHNSQPAPRSTDQPGAGKAGDQHGAPPVQPGESWGNLPPAEREKILQSLRERYPSRYRQLVEQYYRSLAEQK